MNRLLFRAAVAAVVLGLSASAALATTYYNVDEAVGGPMELDLLGASYDAGAGQWTISLRGTNTSAGTLYDVHWVQQFIWDSSQSPWPAFDWDDTNRVWEYGALSWTTYGVMGQNLLMAMSDTDTPLSWSVAGRETAYVQATDSLPALSLGDFAPFEVKDFTLYSQVSSQYPAQIGGFFVAVPEPAAILSLASAAVFGLLAAARRRRRGA
jgi:hypothetical protein